MSTATPCVTVSVPLPQLTTLLICGEEYLKSSEGKYCTCVVGYDNRKCFACLVSDTIEAAHKAIGKEWVRPQLTVVTPEMLQAAGVS